MVIGDQDLPLLTRHHPIPSMHGPALGVDPLLGAGAAEHERPGIGRVGQHVVHRRVGGLGPEDPRGTVAPTREQHTVLAQPDQHLPGGTQFLETAEHRSDGLTNRLVGAQHHLVVLVVVQADRKALAQFTFGSLVFEPRGQPRPDQMQLGLRHRPLQPEHQAVVEIGRVIHPVSVGDQSVGDRAQVQQLIPVGVVAGQPRHLDAQHDPDLAQADIGDQLLETGPSRGLRPGAAQIGIDHHDR
jgi:hypothetical protein